MTRRQRKKNKKNRFRYGKPTSNIKCAELILTEIVSNLKESKLDLQSNASKDGRVNSSLLESIVNEHLTNDEEIGKYLKENHLKLIIPAEREWYDLCIANNNYTIFVPINIKISSLKTADNVSSKKGLFYACTGIIPENKDFNFGNNIDRLKTNKWSEFYDKLKRDIDKNTDADYYFLILNKNDSSDVFYTSLKTLQTVVPNGNNLPFLCNWNNNRIRIFRTHEESRKYLLKIFNESLTLAYESVSLGLQITKELSD